MSMKFLFINTKEAFILSQENENILDLNILINDKILSSTSCAGGGGQNSYDCLYLFVIFFILYANYSATYNNCLEKRDSYYGY